MKIVLVSIVPNTDSNYKPPSSLDVAKLRPRKSSPRFSMATNVATSRGVPPENYIVTESQVIFF